MEGERFLSDSAKYPPVFDVHRTSNDFFHDLSMNELINKCFDESLLLVSVEPIIFNRYVQCFSIGAVFCQWLKGLLSIFKEECIYISNIVASILSADSVRSNVIVKGNFK